MAGLGLMQAVQAYSDGVEWKQRQDQMAKQQKREATMEQINTSTGEIIKKAEADDYAAQQRAWLDGGNDVGKFQPKPFTPPDDMMFQVSMQRGKELMKAGFIEDAVKNEAMTQAQRLRVRQSALERFRVDRDHVKLAMATYPTIPDGKSIVEGTTIEGAPAGLEGGVTAGMAAQPKMIKFKLSDGSTHSMEPRQIEELAMRMADPNAAANEAAANLARIKAQIEADKQKDVEAERGHQARLTDGVRTEGDIRVEGVRGEQARRTEGFKATIALGLADVNNKAAQQRTETSAGATVKAAQLGKEGRVEAAGVSAGKDGKGEKDESKSFNWTGEAAKHYGESEMGMMGKAGASSPKTLALATSAREIYEANTAAGKKITPQQAMLLAAKVSKK